MNKAFFTICTLIFLSLLTLSCSKKLHLEKNSNLAATELSTENLEKPYTRSCYPTETGDLLMEVEVDIDNSSYEETIAFYYNMGCSEENLLYKYRVLGDVENTYLHPNISKLKFLEITRKSVDIAVFNQDIHNDLYSNVNNSPSLGVYHPLDAASHGLPPQFHIITYDSDPDDHKMKIFNLVVLMENYDDGINANLAIFNDMTQSDIDSYPHQYEKI